MSSRVFQSVIIQMKDATDRVIGMVDSEGTIIASSELSLIGTKTGDMFEHAVVNEDGIAEVDGKTVKLLGVFGAEADYAVFVEGTDKLARTVCIMASVAISEAKAYYEEKYDKTALIRNIITDNILPGDIYVHVKELHFVTDVMRAVFLVRQIGKTDVAIVETLQKVFPDKQKDFVISINETDVAVVKEIPANADAKDLHKIAELIEKTVESELSVKTVIGVGTPVKHLGELASRYKEAQIAIDVGKVFDTEKSIINYENLGIGRLIYQLPTTLCEMFLSEVFKKSPIDSLDQETLGIITKFFENNLNISETSRKLFVHRNTLVYRLGKIKKLTGLDLREFDQAIVFKVALMVKKYLDSQK